MFITPRPVGCEALEGETTPAADWDRGYPEVLLLSVALDLDFLDFDCLLLLLLLLLSLLYSWPGPDVNDYFDGSFATASLIESTELILSMDSSPSPSIDESSLNVSNLSYWSALLSFLMMRSC